MILKYIASVTFMWRNVCDKKDINIYIYIYMADDSVKGIY